ncbi:MAG: hypothetical protein ACEQSC_00540, partial [Candidatus Nanopelagicaceae bacterium]
AQPYKYMKLSTAAKAVGYQDLIDNAGTPGAGVTPTAAGTSYNVSSVGALPIGNNLATKECFLGAVSGFAQNICNLQLIDRLVGWGGLSGIVVGAQALGAIALPRYVSGDGVMGFLKFWVGTGATTQTATVLYTNELGVSGRSTTVVIPTNPTNGQMLPIPLVGADKGMRSIQSVSLPATTGTAGNFGAVLAVPLAGLSGQYFQLNWLDLGLAKIQDGACLGFIEICSTTTTGIIDLTLALSDV